MISDGTRQALARAPAAAQLRDAVVAGRARDRPLPGRPDRDPGLDRPGDGRLRPLMAADTLYDAIQAEIAKYPDRRSAILGGAAPGAGEVPLAVAGGLRGGRALHRPAGRAVPGGGVVLRHVLPGARRRARRRGVHERLVLPGRRHRRRRRRSSRSSAASSARPRRTAPRRCARSSASAAAAGARSSSVDHRYLEHFTPDDARDGRRRPPVPRGRPLMQGPTYAAAAARRDPARLRGRAARTSPPTRPPAATSGARAGRAGRSTRSSQELKDSGLRGRGGAGFPTGMKVSFIGKGERVTWSSTPTSPSPARSRTAS